MPGVKRIYYPGEIEEERRQHRLEHGIPIEESTWSRIVESGEAVGVPAPTELTVNNQPRALSAAADLNLIPEG